MLRQIIILVLFSLIFSACTTTNAVRMKHAEVAEKKAQTEQQEAAALAKITEAVADIIKQHPDRVFTIIEQTGYWPYEKTLIAKAVSKGSDFIYGQVGYLRTPGSINRLTVFAPGSQWHGRIVAPGQIPYITF